MLGFLFMAYLGMMAALISVGWIAEIVHNILKIERIGNVRKKKEKCDNHFDKVQKSVSNAYRKKSNQDYDPVIHADVWDERTKQWVPQKPTK